MTAENSRLAPLFAALARVELAAELAVHSDDMADEMRNQFLGVDGVLVWVDPVTGRDDRSILDAILRDVASQGVYVSAHPDVILKMGTKEVLYDTRDLGWGCDTHIYRSMDEFRDQFPARLASDGPRVLKQHRGNGGIGVHKVELVSDPSRAQAATPSDPQAAVVRVQHARVRDEQDEQLALGELMARCEKYFTYSGGSGRLVDQAFQPRINEGMIRCYLVKHEVVGFARQYPPGDASGAGSSAPAHTPRPENVFGLASDKTMYAADAPDFAGLRKSVESEWVPTMQTRVGVDAAALPVLWDADFLFGPKAASGDDTYVLCEINVSAVFPFPPDALPKLADATSAAVRSAK